MIALVDANAFYASCETVFRPEWRNRGVAVLSNNDGCVVACNRKAKALGVQKWKPLFQQPVLQSNGTADSQGVIFVSSNYALYADLSLKMMDVIGEFSPDQHVYSIDEAFLDFKFCEKAIPDLNSYCAEIRKAVWKRCRIPTSIGVGETLTIAKIGSHIAKTSREWKGVCVIETESERKRLLKSVHVSDVWGIGSRLTRHLKHMGLDNALQLANSDPKKMRKEFSVEMERVILELNGQQAKAWDQNEVTKQQIFSTRSLGERVTQIEHLCQAIAKHAAIASAKARKQQSLAMTMTVFASTSSFDKEPHYSKSVTIKFAYPTADAEKIVAAATNAAKQIFRPNVRFYKVGVGLTELTTAKYEQTDLFNQNPNNKSLMTVLDGLNTRFGRDTLFLAAQGIQEKWEMRRSMLTPQYTTNWKDLPKLKCS